MKRSILWCALALAALCGQLTLWPARADTAQPLALVKDINTAPRPTGSLNNSTAFGVVGGALLFSASTPQTGNELWATDGTSAGTRLVKDILPGEEGTFEFQNAASLVLNGRLLFTPNDSAHGTELWATDGTPAGTQLMKDLFSGADSSDPYGFVALGNRAFFKARVSQSEQALGITDGTPGGTTLLGTFGHLQDTPVLVGNTLFFVAAAAGVDFELWRSDGTPEGTQLVKDIWPGLTSGIQGNLFAADADSVWFSGSDGTTGFELWRSDGTAGGTKPFRPQSVGTPILQPREFVALRRAAQAGDPTTLLFNATDPVHGEELWVSDGTPQGTDLLKDVDPIGSSSPLFLSLGGDAPATTRAFYAMDDGTHGVELWATDGTPQGTIMLADANPGRGDSQPNRVTSAGATSFFVATSDAAGRELWRTDGTPQGTAQVADINGGGASSFPGDLTVFSGWLYFNAEDEAHGRELWRTDGSRTELVQDTLPGSDSGARRVLKVALGALFFGADDGVTGAELWKTDGAPEHTTLVKNIAPDDGGTFLASRYNVTARGDEILFGVDPRPLTEVFAARAGANSNPMGATVPARLWRSDGTAAGTTAVRAFPSSSNDVPLYGMTTLRDGVLFAGDDGLGVTELWRTDGTPQGTATITDVVRPNLGFVNDLTRLNDLVVFDVYTTTTTMQNEEHSSLWASDGTAAGTHQIRQDMTFGRFSNAVSGNTLFFGFASRGSNNVELWASDGTTAGTRQLSQFGATDPGGFIDKVTPGRAGEVFFVASTSMAGNQLWKSDGTRAGTALVSDLRVGRVQLRIRNLAYAGGRLFFTANDGIHGTELWASDGTAQGSGPVADIYPGAGSSSPSELLEVNGLLYFSATGADGRRTLWRSDGSAAGTQPVREDAGAPLDPYNLADDHGQLLFSAADEAHGREPWRSDGTAAGTQLMQDIAPGPVSSNPQAFIVAGKQLFLTADTPGVGRELWALAPNAPGQPTPAPAPANPVYLPIVRR